MSYLAEFVRVLLHEGKAVLRAPPSPAGPDPDAPALLARAFADFTLTVGGPPVGFDATVAVAAAALVQHSCWHLLNRTSADPEVEKTLAMPGPPRSPAQHLSADLLLRFVPQLHRRARAQDPADVLTTSLARLLREWPLSGVLASVDEPPLTAPEFAGHPGLLLLYAERWSRNPKPAWMPSGRGREYVELVWNELGKEVSLLPAAGPVVVREPGEGDE